MNINFLEIIIAGVVAMVLGALWYGPLFGKMWMGLVGMTKKDMEAAKGRMTNTYILSFAAFLVMAFGMSYVVDMSGAVTLGEGLMAGFWVWLPFVFTTQFINNMYQSKPLNLTLVDSGYMLAVLLAMGATMVLI